MIKNNIQVDEKALCQLTITELIQYIKDHPNEFQVTKGAWSQLQMNARVFYNAIASYGDLNIALKDMSNLKPEVVKANIADIRNQYQLLAIFATQVDNYFGRNVMTLFIKTQKKDIKIYELDEEEAYRQMTLGGRLTASTGELLINKDGMVEVEEEKAKIFKGLQKIQTNYVWVSPIYKEVLRRYLIGQKQSSKFHAIMWKNHEDTLGDAYIESVNDRWSIGRVYNKGDIAEAYSGALVHEQKYLTPNGNEEANVGAFYNYYITKVDSMAAILGPDIEEENGVGYAIKAPGSRPPSLNQYYRAAAFIKDLTKEPVDLAEALIEQFNYLTGSTRNQQAVGEALVDFIEEQSPEILAKIATNINNMTIV